MTVDPLFQVNDLNPTLYRRIKQLERTRLLRTQIFYIKDFLFTCRFAEELVFLNIIICTYHSYLVIIYIVILTKKLSIYYRLQDSLQKEPIYMLNDPHVYAIQDLVGVKSGLLTEKLRELVKSCCSHVAKCEVHTYICLKKK